MCLSIAPAAKRRRRVTGRANAAIPARRLRLTREPKSLGSAVALIDAGGSAKLGDLSAQLHVSPYHLQRAFKRAMGVSPRQYALARRVKDMKTGLRNGASATEAIYEAGFGSSSRAYAQSASLGMTPGAYGRGGRGMVIGYALADSALGRMLLAATPRGVCAVYFGDSDDELRRALSDEYPAAHIERSDADPELEARAAAVAEYLDSGRSYASLSSLPLDVYGTAFQARVWQALRDIPPGDTRTYAEVAKAIGRPAATRAVANACAANRAAMIIPCHRVVRADGGVGGYRWGEERKRRLLDEEIRRHSNPGAGVQSSTKAHEKHEIKTSSFVCLRVSSWKISGG